MHAAAPPLIAGLGPIVSRYDLILCDVWGVVHDGRAAYGDAMQALEQARAAGRTVILLSNAPRPGAVVRKQMAGYGVRASCYDEVITSGDVTRDELAARPGTRVYHLGPPRDLPNYDGLDLRLVDLDAADLLVCTGLFDDTREGPDDYTELLSRARARGLLMLCANPDLVVERGTDRIWCAGALAQTYARLGGEVLYAGKPYPAIYRSALAHAARIRGAKPARSRVLAIGDGVRTDLAGAANEGFDCLFVAGGIHGAELGLGDTAAPDPARLADVFAEAGAMPAAIIRRLLW